MPADWIYLASQSPRRRQLLDQLGVRHELLLPRPHEDAEALEAVRPGEAPGVYVRRVTRAKLAAAVVRRRELGLAEAPILCADTTVAIDRQILGKPADAEDACRMLALLAGREHRVLTAVALDHAGATTLQVSASRVRFEPLSRAQIERYVASGEPMGKAGAYAIQSQAGAWVVRIAGSYSGIMGLPLHETAALLRPCGWDL
ncbi:septum formation protein [Sphaerotilus hippei]|uniref:dTTP/UTP pyrophosphatase n=1 Tax=Sphaerotilus hippei TaxID=744406 RepID=A0A318GZ34_9BURK|nr:Maf family protein [Sphaerotilus hippei]PXW94785.1 septum formation protein [Sphaerotilus hippei]